MQGVIVVSCSVVSEVAQVAQLRVVRLVDGGPVIAGSQGTSKRVDCAPDPVAHREDLVMSVRQFSVRA